VRNSVAGPISLSAQQYLLTGLFPFGFLQPLLNQWFPSVGNIYTILYAALFNVFTSLGMNGANLLVSGSMAWALAKASFNFLCQRAYSLIAKQSPGQSWLPIFKSIMYYANPWFVLDIVQSFNPNFSQEGFKLPFVGLLMSPFLNSSISSNQTIVAWNAEQRQNKVAGRPVDPAYPKCFTSPLTKTAIGYVPPTLDASGNPILGENNRPIPTVDVNGKPAHTFGYLDYLTLGLMLPYLYLYYTQFIELMPGNIRAEIEPTVNWIITILGGIIGLGGTLIAGSFMAAPSAFASLMNLLPSAQTGGAPPPKTQKGGASFPTLNEVIHDAIDSTPPSLPVLEGGGEDMEESAVFLGSLGIAALAGLCLALIRSKKERSSKVE
jgi:hypothetical protein